MKFQECHSEVMRHGQKIYPSHHRIEMAVGIASLKKNSNNTAGQLLWDVLMGTGKSGSNVALT
uniref:Uncharacterized protein n=1 Tax=Cavia porcellus TaxID=10141 RepID=A0A286XTY3_CAVPO